MKIKKIAAICAKDKQYYLYDQHHKGGQITQWLGTESAIYPISNVPYLDEEAVYTLFDVPLGQRNDGCFLQEQMPTHICAEDVDSLEQIIDNQFMSFIHRGRTLRPLQLQDGKVVFIQSRYLDPIDDLYIELFERRGTNGDIYIAAKEGLILRAIIFPYDVIDKFFVGEMQLLAKSCARTLAEKQEEEQQIKLDSVIADEAQGIIDEMFGDKPKDGGSCE